MSVKHNKTFNMFIIVLGQHVSILIESSSGPSKKIDPFLNGPEDDSTRIETSSGPSMKIDPFLEGPEDESKHVVLVR